MNSKVALAAVFVALLLLFVAAEKSINVSKAEDSSPLSMPEEYVNYTITRIDGILCAKIDGVYPILYAGSEESMLMVYPTPPGTTNISLVLDNIELAWSNFTVTYPDALHHTAIGDWQMISAVVEPFSGYFAVRGYFVLRIHYEHPVQVLNGSYVFLYDLNIKEYLSDASNRSVAHFTIRMDIEYSNLKVNTVFGPEEMLKPIDFMLLDENPLEIRVDEVSEFGKPLPGDLLVSFTEANAQEPVSVIWIAALALVIGFAVAGLGFYSFLRHGKRDVL